MTLISESVQRRSDLFSKLLDADNEQISKEQQVEGRQGQDFYTVSHNLLCW